MWGKLYPVWQGHKLSIKPFNNKQRFACASALSAKWLIPALIHRRKGPGVQPSLQPEKAGTQPAPALSGGKWKFAVFSFFTCTKDQLWAKLWEGGSLVLRYFSKDLVLWRNTIFRTATGTTSCDLATSTRIFQKNLLFGGDCWIFQYKTLNPTNQKPQKRSASLISSKSYSINSKQQQTVSRLSAKLRIAERVTQKFLKITKL